jgi:GNAT superfamily N-acetyltransferase
MIVDAWDHRISDVAKACSIFVKESMYPIEYNEYNTLNTLHSMFNDLDTDILVDYSDDVLNGFAIVQRTDEFHTEYFGYLGKFYILPDRRGARAAFRLAGEVVNWFDQKGCVVSFATATAGIGKDDAFIKLLSRFGYTANETGILTRKKHE